MTAVASISTRSFRERQPSDSQERAGRLTANGGEAAGDDVPERAEEGVDIGRVVVEPHDILEGKAGSVQDGLEVDERKLHLRPHVAGVDGSTLLVDGRLTGAVENTVPAGDLDGLREAEVVLPAPRVDVSLLHRRPPFTDDCRCKSSSAAGEIKRRADRGTRGPAYNPDP